MAAACAARNGGSERVKILIVGAGAVGAVYAWHLQRGGAEVWLYVRPKYRAACEAGLTLYDLNRGRRPGQLRADGCLSEVSALGAHSFDQVWLCISTTALCRPWFEPFAAALGDATIVALQPGPEAQAWLLERVPAERLVSGLISMVSYQAPLPGERLREPGIAYWLPPLSPQPFKGPRAAQVIGALRAGGCAAKEDPQLEQMSGFGSGVLMPLMASLELAGWSFSTLKRGHRLRDALRAADEACRAIAAELGVAPPFWLRLLRPGLARLVITLAPRVVPLDLETYFAYHFSKVGDQTRLLLAQYAALASRHGVPSDGLGQLRAGLG